MDFRWDIVSYSIPILLKATVLTIQLTVVSVVIGTIIGLFISLARLSAIKPLKWLAAAYIDFLRGTPLLVQIMIIHFGIPILLLDTPFEYVPDAFISAVVALSLNSGAYVAEIFRAGIQSIDKGQMEASKALGMNYYQSMRHVILPQAFKVSIPPLGNEFIAILKDSSLVLVIGLQELMTSGKLIVGFKLRPFEVYITVAIIYLIMTKSISLLINYMERRLKISDRN